MAWTPSVLSEGLLLNLTCWTFKQRQGWGWCALLLTVGVTLFSCLLSIERNTHTHTHTHEQRIIHARAHAHILAVFVCRLPSVALDAGSHRGGFNVVLLPLLSLSVPELDACMRHYRAPRWQTDTDDKQDRSSRGCCGLCHSRVATTIESHTGFLSAGDRPRSGVSARPGPEGTGLLFGLVLWFFFLSVC